MFFSEWYNAPDKKYDRVAIIVSIASFVIMLIFTQTQFQISTLWDKPKIETTLASEIKIYHNYGTLFLNANINIKNTGKVKESISKVYFYIKKLENNKSKRFEKLLLLQESYDPAITNSGEYIYYPVFDIYLIPDDFFRSKIRAYETWGKDELKKMDNFRDKIYAEIKAKIDSGESYPRINDNLKYRVNTFIEENIKNFSSGNYALLVIPFDNNNPIQPDKYYTFSVLESDISKIEEITEDYYRGGNGIYYSTKSRGFSTTLFSKVDKKEIEDLMSGAKNIGYQALVIKKN